MSEAKKKSDSIDRELKREAANKKISTDGKLLLLGPADSGKTTVLKQMKILHGDGFSKEDRLEFRRKIHDNVIDAMKLIVEQVYELEFYFPPESEAHAHKIASYNKLDHDTIPPDVIESIKIIWNDPVSKNCALRSDRFFFPDAAHNFLNSLEKYFQPDYMPTDQDILWTRVRTFRITETKFNIQGCVYRIYDVGGQRSVRAFWVPFFDEVDAIIYIASLAGYNQVMAEDSKTNRMLDAIKLFHLLSNHVLLRGVAIILFLNKVDLFEEKIQSFPIRPHFPDYPEESPINSEAAKNFFRKLFLQQHPNPASIYLHYTTSTDTNLMKNVISSVV